METFSGRAHLPGDTRERNIELAIDWLDKEVNIRFLEPPGPIADWPGLLVQTIGVEEAIFRTKGIPPLLTHWWHLARSAGDNLWGFVVAAPDVNGTWRTCSLRLKKVS
jgi:hypothetical protein